VRTDSNGLALQAKNKWLTALNIMQYHLGRVITYAILGGLIGLLGRGLFLAGLQRSFSIGAGILLLIMAVFSLKASSSLVSIPVVNRAFFWVKSMMGRLLKNKSPSSILYIGMLNGLLPCGLVYMAIVGAVSTGAVIKGMGYMALFGLGTVPLVLVASVVGTFAGIRLRNTLRKLVPVLLVAFAVLLIMRGLNFDLPANFSFWESTENQLMCN